jgi:hypothetical protein
VQKLVSALVLLFVLFCCSFIVIFFRCCIFLLIHAIICDLLRVNMHNTRLVEYISGILAIVLWEMIFQFLSF